MSDEEQPRAANDYPRGIDALFSPTAQDKREIAHVTKYSATERERILDAVKPRLFIGEKIGDLAAEYGIGKRTLEFWLAQLGDEYRQLRRAWVDTKLVDAEEGLHAAQDKIQVAKWRELFKVAAWWAERRDPERYAPKSEITVKDEDPRTPEQVRERIAQLEAKLGVKTIEAEKVAEEIER